MSADSKPVPLENNPDEPISLTRPLSPPLAIAPVRTRPDVYEIAAWIITGLTLLLVLRLRLLTRSSAPIYYSYSKN